MSSCYYCFFFNDAATTEIYTLSLHDALPISPIVAAPAAGVAWPQNDHKEWQSKTVADKTKSDLSALFSVWAVGLMKIGRAHV